MKTEEQRKTGMTLIFSIFFYSIILKVIGTYYIYKYTCHRMFILIVYTIEYKVLGIPVSSCILIKKNVLNTLYFIRTIFYFKLYRYFIRVIKDSHIFVTTFFLL